MRGSKQLSARKARTPLGCQCAPLLPATCELHACMHGMMLVTRITSFTVPEQPRSQLSTTQLVCRGRAAPPTAPLRAAREWQHVPRPCAAPPRQAPAS